MNNNCLILVCHKPNPIWLEFLNSFQYYRIFIIIDDETVNYEHLCEIYRRLNFIFIDKTNCMVTGITNMCFTLNKMVSGWEKAFFFVVEEHTRDLFKNYDNIWFMEDDVFFYDEKTLKDLDDKYPTSDLLTAPCYLKTPEDKWLWNVIHTKFEEPHYHAMVCAARISRKILDRVYDYADEHKVLFFVEALIPTIAKQFDYKYDTPEELSTIQFQYDWAADTLNRSHFFHPVKNIQLHKDVREGKR